MDKKSARILKEQGVELYELRKQIAKLQLQEEKLRKWVASHLDSEIVIPMTTSDGKKLMGVSDVPQIILKPAEDIAAKIGRKEFLAMVKIGIGDLRKYCEEHKLRFRQFIKETKNASRVTFT